MATGNEPTIEVDVVEIDGIAVEPRTVGAEQKKRVNFDWSAWQGRVMRLNTRWWPLWLVVGFIVLSVTVIFGLCIAVLLIAWRMIKVTIDGLVSLINPSSRSHR